MRIQATVTATIEAADYSHHIYRHAFRTEDDGIRHRNEHIRPERTHMNDLVAIEDEHAAYERHYGDYVRDLDTRRRGRPGSAKAKYETVENYLTQTRGDPDEAMVLQFGDTGLQELLLSEFAAHGVDESEVFGAYNAAMRQVVAEHNRQWPQLPIIRYATNVDESYLHAHAQLVPMGHDKRGHPTRSLTAALSEHYQGNEADVSAIMATRDGKMRRNEALLALYNRERDRMMCDTLARAYGQLAKDHGFDLSIEHVRTGAKATGLTMEERQATNEARRKAIDLDTDISRKNDAIDELDIEIDGGVTEEGEEWEGLQPQATRLKGEINDLKAQTKQDKKDADAAQKRLNGLQTAERDANEDLAKLTAMEGQVRERIAQMMAEFKAWVDELLASLPRATKIEAALAEQAERHGQSPDEFTKQLASRGEKVLNAKATAIRNDAVMSAGQAAITDGSDSQVNQQDR